MKIAIFLSEWPIGILPWACTIVEGLANRGFEVHLFIRNGDRGDGLFDARVKVFDLTSFKISDAETLFAQYGSMFPISEYIDKESLVAAYAMGCSNKYDWCLGLERMGLLLAKTAAVGSKSLLAYMSFELYEPSHPGVYKEKLAGILRHEANILSSVDLFIIQDSVREAHYYRILGDDVSPKETLYYPISLTTAEKIQQPKEWHRKYNIPSDTKIILYTGSIGVNRFVEEFVLAAQAFPEEYKLIIHGPAYDQFDYLYHLRKLDINNRTILSTDLVGWKERSLLAASADIGIVYYRNEPVNDRDTARSSDKVAAYLAAGIPFVGPNYQTYQDIAGSYHCCVLIDDPLRMASGVQDIFDQYAYYKDGANRAFDKEYNADNNLDRLNEILHRIKDNCEKAEAVTSQNDSSAKNVEETLPPDETDESGVFENEAYQLLGYEQLAKNSQKLDPTVSLFSQISRISFQLSNICNYETIHKKCPLHCSSPKIVLRTSIITNVLDELSEIDYSGIIAFHIYNEPLIDPRLFSLIAKTHNKCPKAKVYILSNGYYLNQNILDELETSVIWLLIVSAYSKYEFDRLSKYVTSIPYKVFHASLDDRQNLYEGPLLNTKAPCYPFVTDLSIACTGEVTLCCLDWDRRFVFGNLNNGKLHDILEKEDVRLVANKLMHGQRTLDICRRCNWVR